MSDFLCKLRGLSKDALVRTVGLLAENSVGLEAETVLRFARAADNEALARRIQQTQQEGHVLVRRALDLGLIEATPAGYRQIPRRASLAEERLLHRLRCTGQHLARMNRKIEAELARDGRKPV